VKEIASEIVLFKIVCREKFLKENDENGRVCSKTRERVRKKSFSSFNNKK